MTGPDAIQQAGGGGTGERRRVERRVNVRVADLALPELRRILLTTVLSAAVIILFLWMVRTVVIAGILGVVIGAYLRPLYSRFRRGTDSPTLAAMLTMTIFIAPLLAMVIYSYVEISRVVEYVTANQDQIATQIDASLRRYPIMGGLTTTEQIREWLVRATDYGAKIPEIVQDTVISVAVATTIFLFTAFYILTDAEGIIAYIRGKIPPRYTELVATLESNVRGVLYGAIYATLLTQALKTIVILGMNLFFHVPLAVVLALLSFIIGFFPIVGSWSVYVPVAIWVLIFRDSLTGALAMVAIGLLLNTVFISMYLRPKLAAEKSRVLNFFWMFVGLVTGVYTFGIAGILLGPILIGLLKAVIDTVTATASWRMLDEEGEPTSATPSILTAP